MSMLWVSIGSAAISAGTSIYSATQTDKAANKAVDAKRQLVDNLKYEPIDIEKLKAEATKSAIENATQSLALERQLQPNVAATRENVSAAQAELSRQVGADLKLGGNLSPDVANRVTTAGRTIGAASGIGQGSTVPLTASLLGLSSIDLLNQRRSAAGALAMPGPSPEAGLDPGAIASLEVANNAANNQFNLAKAGADSSLIDAEAAARTAQIGGQTGIASSLSGLLLGQPTTSATGGLLGSYLNSRKPAFPITNVG